MGTGGLKKKELSEPPLRQKFPEQQQNKFKSIFAAPELKTSAPPVFMPPESFGIGLSPGKEEEPLDISSASAWDVATRYHEFKSRPAMKPYAKQLRRISARAILDRAQEVLGALVHPIEQKTGTLRELPATAEQADIDLDETLESSPLAAASAHGSGASRAPITADDIWMTYQTHRPQAVVLTVDTSLSMTGEKLALTAVALAVVLLQFPEDPIGIVAFENEAKVLKRPDERIGLQELVERFLDVPAQGYTHLEDGMRAALQVLRGIHRHAEGRPPSAVLLTDGKYTAGKDPAYLAPRFPHLVVLKMGHEWASLELCRELARKGHGALREIAKLESLPEAMYGIVKDLLRGRSVA